MASIYEIRRVIIRTKQQKEMLETKERRARMENEAKISCFAYRNREGHEGCTALRELYCKKEECKFYKPDHKVDMKQLDKDIRAYSVKK